MSYLQLLWLVLTLVSFDSVQSKAICDISEPECATKIARRFYSSIVAGIAGVIQPSDPLIYNEEVNVTLEKLTYTIFDSQMLGMKNCEVLQLKCNTEELSFEYELRCPKLTIITNYVGHGYLGTVPVNGKGVSRIIMLDYIIIINGKYQKFISKNDQKPHYAIISQNMDGDPKGRVIFDEENLVDGDAEKSALASQYENEDENWREIELLYRHPIMDIFMNVWMEHINSFMEMYPVYKDSILWNK